MALPLERLRFSTTSVLEPMATTLRNTIVELGGQCRRNLEATTQFLILGDLGRGRWSQKYNFTMEMRSDIVILETDTIQAMHDIWMSGKDIDGRAELRERKLRPFQGLRVCLTNLPNSEREFLTSVIQDNGGEVSGSLKSECHVLISAQDSGRKVEAARAWHIPVVVPEWAIKSLERGYAWSPEMFLIHLAPEDRKKSLCSDAGSTIVTSMVSGTTSLASKNRALRSESAWNSLMGAPSAKRAAPERPDSRSLAPPAKKAASTIATPNVALFQGLKFSLHGFDERQANILQKTLESHGATIVQENRDYYIVYSLCENAPSTDSKCITEWAIERSLHKKSLLLDDVWGTHIGHKKIKDFSGLEICLSGFSGIELLHLSRLIPVLGGQFCETLTAQRDVLISTKTSNKFKHAQSWDIPIVNENWLWECARKGELVDLAKFVLEGSTCTSLARRLSTSNNQPILTEQEPPTAGLRKLKAPVCSEAGIIYDDETEPMLLNVVEIKPAVNARRRI